MQGDSVYLARVLPSIDNVNNASRYEFFAGNDDQGRARWSAGKLEDAKPLFVEYQQAGVEFVQTLQSEPWGARTFMVRDPDGNLLLFAGRGE